MRHYNTYYLQSILAKSLFFLLAISFLFTSTIEAKATYDPPRLVVIDIPPPCDHPDFDALMALYNSTNGTNWTDNTGWVDGAAGVDCEPCGWYGVTCDGDDRVICVDMDGDVDCSSPTNTLGNNLIGSIPSEIGEVSNLLVLSLSNNQLNGTIPSALDNLSNLLVLSLSNNQLSGMIPPALDNLSNLLVLSLSNNQLSGMIPPALDNLSNLEILSLHNNQLNGVIPSSLGGLINLTQLYLQNNQLESCFPDELSIFCNLGFSTNSSSNGYNFTGNSALPWSGDFQQLCDGENQIGAICDDGDVNTTNEEILDNCTCEELPSNCSHPDYAALMAFYNSTNGLNWTVNSGWIDGANGTSCDPCSWLGITCNNDGRVICIDLDGNSTCDESTTSSSGNNLTGILPNELSDLIFLEKIFLNSNNLGGNIPLTINNLSNLKVLNLSNNQLNGFIPPALDYLNDLWYLSLKDNELSGMIPPELGNLMELKYLSLAGNEFSSGIPSELGNLTALQVLRLNENQLSGSIPPELGNLASLHYLILSNNQLSGSIPSSLGSLANLQGLQLSGNELSGTIPSELGSLDSLKTMYLHNNELTGSIPSELGNLFNLDWLILAGNELNGIIPPELGNLAKLQYLHAGGNQLSGSIPPELGNLASLHYLILGNNQLSGSIPGELGSLTNLWQLSLSNNQLSGCFPYEIASHCTITYNFINNPALPWSGDFESFCNNEEQIESPCDDGSAATTNDQIQEDCTCSGIAGTCPIGTTITVTSDADEGIGTLRAALICANTNSDLDTIFFTEAMTIFPLSELPPLMDNGIHILGLANGLVTGDVVINGEMLPDTANLINITNTSNIYLEGLVLKNAARTGVEVRETNELYIGDCQIGQDNEEPTGREGIALRDNSSNFTLNNCYIYNNAHEEILIHNVEGFSITNCIIETNSNALNILVSANGNISNNRIEKYQNSTPTLGVQIRQSQNINVGSEGANSIYEMSSSGISIGQNNTSNILIENNYLGTNEEQEDLGNGIAIFIFSPVIGTIVRNNVIAHNYSAIRVTGDECLISQNQIFCNKGDAIYLSTGANQGMQSGEITVATPNKIEGFTANTTDQIEIYRTNRAYCPSDTVCQGAEYLGTATTEGVGSFHWSFTPQYSLNLGDEVVVLAIDDANIRSSAFSECVIVVPTCTHPDYPALMALYTSTNGENWTNNTGWAAGAAGTNCEPCTWYGVACNPDGRVTCLDLDGQANCGGTEPTNTGNNLNGTLPTELGDLIFLERIDFSTNGENLTGEIPASIGNLSNLRVLSFASNGLSGNIPPEIGNLSSLEYLGLNSNHLTGDIPVELSALPNISTIQLYNNELSGCFPEAFSTFCDIDYDFSDNPNLPGGGDFDAFCADQTGICNTFDGVILTMGDIETETGATICLPVTVSGYSDIISTLFTINYDPSFLEFTEVEGFNLPSLNTNNFGIPPNTDQGIITISWVDFSFNGVTLPDSSSIFSVCFNVLAENGTSSVDIVGSPVSIEILDINENIIPIITNNGNVTVADNTNSSNNGFALTLTEVSSVQGSIVCIDMLVDNFESISGLEFSINYNTDLLDFSSIGNFNLTGLDINDFNFPGSGAIPGTITLSWANGSGVMLANGSAIFEVCFTITGNTGISPVSFGSDPVAINVTAGNGDTVTPDLDHGSVTVLGGGGGGPTYDDFTFVVTEEVAQGAGEEVCVSVQAYQFANLISTQFTIVYDPTMLSYSSLGNFNLPGVSAANFGTPPNTDDGVITFSWTDNTFVGIDLAGGTTMFDICFNTILDSGITPIEFSSTPLHIEVLEILNGNQNLIIPTLDNGLVTIEIGEVEGFALFVEDVNASTGDDICLDVTAQDFDTIRATQFTLNYDPNILDYTAVQAFNLPNMSENNFGIHESNGNISFSWVDFTAQGITLIPPDSSLFEVCFNVIGTSTTFVTFGNTPTVIEVLDINANEINVNSNDTGVVIIEVMPPNITNTVVTDITCNGENDGVINIDEITGIGPYAYLWNIPDENGSAVTGLAPGEYSVTVIDASTTLLTTASYIVAEPDELTITVVSTTDVLCNNDNTGAIQISVTGGSMPYTIEWNNNLPDGMTQTNLEAGTYTVTVTDERECTTMDTITIESINTPLIITSLIPVNVPNGAINLTVSTGTGSGSYSYEWAGPEGFTSTTEDISSLSNSGIYCVAVTDSIGCTVEECIEVGEDIEITSFLVTNTCVGETQGAIDIEVTGGVGVLTYQWTPSSPTVITQDINNIGAGTYSVIITDENGNQITGTFTVNNFSVMSFNPVIGPADLVTNGSIALNVTGGAPGYTYQWDPNVSTSDVAINLTFGEYCVTVTDQNGCQIETCLIVPSAPFAFTGTGDTDVTCNGFSDGIITVTVNGGIGPYTYTATSGPSPITDATGSFMINGLSPGTVSYTIIDSQGEQLTNTVVIEEPDAITYTSTIINDIEGTDCTGKIVLNIQGGTGFGTYTVTWNAGGVVGSQPTNLCGGDYFPTIIDNNGCILAQNPIIFVAELSDSVVIEDVKCASGDDDGIIDLSPYGSGGYIFEWRPQGEPVISTDEDLTGVAPGAYVVKITDETGAVLINTYIVGVQSNLAVNVDATSNYNGFSVRCSNSTEGTAVATAFDGIGVYSYEWEDEDGNLVEVGPNLNGVAAGNYQLIVIDELGCETTQSLLLSAPAPLGVVEDVDNVTCDGLEDGGVEVLGFGGITNQPYIYQWSDGNIGAVNQFLSQGEYTLTITDGNGCKFIKTYTINVEDQEIPGFQNCPDNIELILNIAQATAVVAEWTPPLATDNCGIENISSNYSPGDTFSSSQTVIYTAEDELGNSNTCNFEITVIETDELLFYIDSSHTIVQGDTALISVCVKNFENIHGFQLGLALSDIYGSNIIGIENIHSDLQDSLTYDIVSNNTLLQITWADVTGENGSPELSLPDSTSIFKLRLVLESTFGDCSDLFFNYDTYAPYGFNTEKGNMIASAIDGIVCKPTKGIIAGAIIKANNSPVPDVLVRLTLDGQISQEVQTNGQGNYRFEEVLLGEDYEISPYLNTYPSNGVSLVDLTIIRHHIFFSGVGTYLDNPYKLIAGDINGGGSIGLTDLTSAMYLLINGEMPPSLQNTSWRFIDRDYVFPNLLNPWSSSFPGSRVILFLDRDILTNDFIGVKIGDVN